VDYNFQDVLVAAEQIVKTDAPAGHGDVRSLENELALILRSPEVSALNAARVRRLEAPEPVVARDTAPPAQHRARGVLIVALFLMIVLGSISLVNWYFSYTYGV
jgi:hypothetical protein